MDLLLERLSPGQIVAVISVVCGCVVGLAMIFAITKYQFQLLADDTALKRERQQAEIAMRQKLIERGAAADTPTLDSLLTPIGGAADAEELNATLAKRLGVLDAEGDEIETTLARAMAAPPARKAAIIAVVDELYANEAQPAAILAAVRSLCATPAKEPAGCA